jgi:hypothetical protein
MWAPNHRQWQQQLQEGQGKQLFTLNLMELEEKEIDTRRGGANADGEEGKRGKWEEMDDTGNTMSNDSPSQSPVLFIPQIRIPQIPLLFLFSFPSPSSSSREPATKTGN